MFSLPTATKGSGKHVDNYGKKRCLKQNFRLTNKRSIITHKKIDPKQQTFVR